MSYIEFHDVVKRFGDNTVLDHISFGIEKGDLVTLLGPSGCGKSTLLRCLSGLEQVSEGSILLDGADITDVPASKRNIGMVFQQYSLFPNMNVEQNIAFGLKMQKVPQDVIDRKVREAIDMVELTGKEKAYPANLSGGQQQRAALARSIVTEPAVLLLDEPLSAIDAKLRRSLQARIREIQQELNLTTIFVTHDQDEAMVMSDVIQLFHAGRIEQAGTPVEVYTKPVSEFAASFIGSYNQLARDEFQAMTGASVPAGHVVAVRPETIIDAVLKGVEILSRAARRAATCCATRCAWARSPCASTRCSAASICLSPGKTCTWPFPSTTACSSLPAPCATPRSRTPFLHAGAPLPGAPAIHLGRHRRMPAAPRTRRRAGRLASARACPAAAPSFFAYESRSHALLQPDCPAGRYPALQGKPPCAQHRVRRPPDPR